MLAEGFLLKLHFTSAHRVTIFIPNLNLAATHPSKKSNNLGKAF